MISIVFDLDGTLIDSAPDLGAAVNRMMSDEGQEPFDLPTITSFIGNGLPRLVELAMGAREMDMTRHAALTQDVLGHYKSANGAYTTLYPGAIESLNTLKTNGHLLGLCTNKPIDAARDVLEQFDLGDLFGAVIGGDSLATRKPDPAPLLATFEALGTPGIYVGDSEVDAETAQRAEVPFALYTEGYRRTPVAVLPHKWSFSDFNALAAIVASAENISA